MFKISLFGLFFGVFISGAGALSGFSFLSANYMDKKTPDVVTTEFFYEDVGVPLEPDYSRDLAASVSVRETDERELGENNNTSVKNASKDIKEMLPATVPEVPFFSQSSDINWVKWRGRACGVASLAMLIEMYKPGETSPQLLLEEGLSSGHYLTELGWTHNGLALMAEEHGLKAETHDLSHLAMNDAYHQFLSFLNDGPVIASVFHGFDPDSEIPHLVVISGEADNLLYYNDPAEGLGGLRITEEQFKKGWKKRFITVGTF
ncbi:MAG: cysteine peptidase family C39 domain-containing protein [Candidatus Paceibacterota bacterium]